ncbi:Sperm autoantigenic protein 17 [Aphelenchoides bicaudatus]|nr:Sperm autoantigenic protein 17 [Aphelenchoides bicaudatus]
MAEGLASKYKVPANLRPLLEAFARETLRTQPPCLIEFGRVFFETLHVAQKSNPRTDVISEERLYNQFRANLQQRLTARESTPDSVKQPSDTQRGSDLPSQRPLPDSAHNLPPLDLQSQRYNPGQSSRFQTPLASQPASKTNTNRMQPPQPGSSGNSRPTTPEALAATKIQAAYRGHIVRSHPEKFGIDTVDFTRRRSNDHLFDTKKDMKRHSVGGYSLENKESSPDDRAAVKIQKEIRGFLARKHYEEMKQKNNNAAVKLQSHIRGYLTRKNLNKDGVSSRSSNHSDEIVH